MAWPQLWTSWHTVAMVVMKWVFGLRVGRAVGTGSLNTGRASHRRGWAKAQRRELYELGERLKGRHHLTGSGPVAVRLVEGVEGHVGFSVAAGGGGGWGSIEPPKTGGGGFGKRAQLTGPLIIHYELCRRCRKLF